MIAWTAARHQLFTPLVVATLVLVGSSVLPSAEQAKDGPQPDEKRVSYYNQIRPIFQAHCQGCHQPAKASGEYVMTAFDALLKGGESESAAIVPGKPDESYLIELITPADGEAEMPKGKKPLSAAEIELIRAWIAQKAQDDTPANAKQVFDKDNPPVYTRPPVITSLDISPDGSLIAVAGFHEVLLTKSDGSGLAARLIGMSERIESVRFSPDGKLLAVTGGLPARMGEVQVWDVAGRKLKLSVPVTYDTLYGGSWSPDGKLIAFGCSDNTIRAIDSTTGKQVLFQGAHADWVLDTVFSKDGSHLISVSRDMSCKLTEVATERFVDNVTSITPGALKGGISALARHPERDEIVIGGSDGTPKVYRAFRITARRIGDDANQIRRMPALTGRVFSVAVSRDGKRIVAGSSLDGHGEVGVYSYEFDTSLPDEIKKINSKTVSQRSAAEKQMLDEYRTRNVKLISKTSIPATGVYAVAYHPDNQRVIVAGRDGRVRLIAGETGQVVKEFPVVTVSDESQTAGERTLADHSDGQATAGESSIPDGTKLASLSVQPKSIQLKHRFDKIQVIVSGRLDSGDVLDVTRMAKFELSAPVANVSSSGLVHAQADGQAQLQITIGDRSAQIPVQVAGVAQAFHADYIRDVTPILSRLGCTNGVCHGAAKGKNGFKLSLRGYDPISDVRALTDDHASRRVNLASPDDSLMLMKPTGAVPHVGAQLIRPGEPYYEIMRSWIAQGAKLDLATPRVVGIDIFPKRPVIQIIGGRQQMRIVATYADGATRDVTHEAFVESGDTEIAETGKSGGVMTALRRGEAPILARFEGAYAATTLTVMGQRTGFAWQDPPTWGRIDDFVAAKWKRMKIRPSSLCTDAEFIRRVYLDLTGVPPSLEDLKKFLADDRDTQVKRDELIGRLIGNNDYVEHWTNKWADLLQVNRKFLGPEGAAAFRTWIRGHVAANTPYDAFVHKILTASGSNKDNPAASYYKVLRTPDAVMENTTHLFLAVRFNCNKCHDHPFERWTQNQYYETAAYFAQVALKADPASGKRRIGGTAVEGAKPFYEVVYDTTDGEVRHQLTGQVAPPKFPFDCTFMVSTKASRRDRLAAWITSRDNQYFARSYVNRLFGYLLGIGIVEPIDDIRAGNPATNPELLDYLTHEFIESGFDVQHVLSLIFRSRTYQLSIETNRWNADDTLNYSHARARRLPAEVLFDAIHAATGSQSKIPGVPAGTRAAAIPDSGIKLADGFLTNLGRPSRESSCECERSSGLELGPVMAFISGPTVADAVGDPNNAITKLVKSEANDARLINELFMRILNRPATVEEVAAAIDAVQSIESDHQALTIQLKERETWWTTRKPQLEKERLEALASAKASLEAYQKQIAPRVVEEEKRRQQQIATAQAELNKYTNALPQKANEWTEKNKSSVEWHMLEPVALAASKGVQLTRLADRSVRASGKGDPGAYTISARTNLRGITGIRLEALPVEGLAGGGPGLSPNGNFVITEFEVYAGPTGKPKEAKRVTLQNPKADFTQFLFNVAQAIDGNARDQRGWAVNPSGGVVHWASFETKAPVGFNQGTTMRFILHQYHRAKMHRLARFRIAVTTDKAPIGLSLPEELNAIVAMPSAQRNKQQTAALLAYFQKTDANLIKRQLALAEAKKPLPEDSGVTNRKRTLEYLSQPVADDSLLVRLRSDVEQSKKQVADKRLTAAQDLAWALINNPAFLFNR